MLNFPHEIASTRLYIQLEKDQELLGHLYNLRHVVTSFAATTARSVPQFTDHTIRHMDALWGICDRILTAAEISRLTTAEAFLLATGFYLHDIGMAYAATAGGLEAIRASASYRSFLATLSPDERKTSEAECRAIMIAVRRNHANAATELATREIPGASGTYLFEAKSFRDKWGTICGEIASSHHWSLEQLDREFGPRGIVPLPGTRKGDPGYVAAILRLIDYAHINRERASTFDRIFRLPLEEESLTHWLAQEHIDGPEREEDELVYRSAKPIDAVDAWWLFYEMLRGLDSEIRAVKRLLERRAHQQSRFSLIGVRGAASPQEAAMFIPTSGFLPIEVNLHTASIERLVELLAGETLYGPNPMAAVRELLQNARDAVALKKALAVTEIEKAQAALPIRVSLDTRSEPAVIEISDFGIGMNKTVMTEYLISIASNYWQSQFASDFPSAATSGFLPAGKFGIGFLAVFMLGDSVTVESNRISEDRLQLTLRGVGRRGELRTSRSAGGSGTTIRIQLKAAALQGITPLVDLVRTYAPTLPHDLVIDVDGHSTTIPVGWLNKLDGDEFASWVAAASGRLGGRFAYASAFSMRFATHRIFWHGADRSEPSEWPVKRPEYRHGMNRLVASFAGRSLLCLRGLAVQTIRTPGFIGVIDLEQGLTDVSRGHVLDADVEPLIATARASIRSQVVENLNALAGLMIDKTDFLGNCVDSYGVEPLLASNVRWISHLRMPGEVELISVSTLIDLLGESNSFFIAYNVGPWTALREWARDEGVSDRETAILVDAPNGGAPGYLRTEEARKGALSDVWEEYERASLLKLIIEQVARAWKMDSSDIVSEKSWDRSDTRVFGRCTRKSV